MGFLAICAGDGLAAVFRDLGCDAVVSGGQTMNPSTESILEGIDQVPAETVFVLPNNGNIIMAAQQCQGLTEKNVVVIPSKTVPQGITAAPLYYLPVLLGASLLTGAVTGVAAACLFRALRHTSILR